MDHYYDGRSGDCYTAIHKYVLTAEEAAASCGALGHLAVLNTRPLLDVQPLSRPQSG